MRTLLLSLIGLSFAASAAEPRPAWQALEALPVSAAKSPAATAALRITIETAALREATQLLLPLANGKSHTVTVVDREQRAGGNLWIVGKLDDASEVMVSLSLTGGYLSGLISSPEGNYEVVTLADGGQAVVTLDQDRFPECAGQDAALPAAPTAPATPAAPASITADPANKTDVLIVFTPQALTGVGGYAQANALAQAAVDSSNLAFLNSDMVTRFRLAGVRATAHAETGDSGVDLSWVAGDAEVAGWRNDVAADMVSLITETMDACGRGYLQSTPGPGFAASAYQATLRSCAVGNLSYVHEHGHNMGMMHDPGNGTGAAHPWGYGHFVNGSFRTVMAYSTNCVGGCTRRPYFSNPAVSYNGNPTGIAEERDNHRTGNLTADIVANFRTSQIIFADDFQPHP